MSNSIPALENQIINTRYVRKPAKLAAWIKDKKMHAQIRDVGEILEQAEAAPKIQTQIKDLNNQWTCLQRLTAVHADQLRLVRVIQRFHREVDETIERIQKKDAALNSDDLWKDSQSVWTPLGICAKLERDMPALENKVKMLDKIANQLVQTHPGSAETILTQQQEINEHWIKLTAKAETRRKESYDLQKFLNDHSDIMTFVNRMIDCYSLPITPTSPTYFDELIDDLELYDAESKAANEKISTLVDFRDHLIESSHYATSDIKEKIQQLKQVVTKQRRRYCEYHAQLEQIMDFHHGLNNFYDNFQNWNSDREVYPFTSRGEPIFNV